MWSPWESKCLCKSFKDSRDVTIKRWTATWGKWRGGGWLSLWSEVRGVKEVRGVECEWVSWWSEGSGVKEVKGVEWRKWGEWSEGSEENEVKEVRRVGWINVWSIGWKETCGEEEILKNEWKWIMEVDRVRGTSEVRGKWRRNERNGVGDDTKENELLKG